MNGEIRFYRCYKIYPRMIKITLCKEKGIYRFGLLSGTGKSYFGSQLSRLAEFGYGVRYFKFNHLVNLYEEIQDKELGNAELVMFDRFDLYISDENLKYLDKISTDRIVFIDSKGVYASELMSKCKQCNIELLRNEIEVYG